MFLFVVLVLLLSYAVFLVNSSKIDNDYGVISITFDDGYKNTYDFAFPLMQYYDYTGTAYIIVNWTGEFEYRNLMNFDEIKDLQDSGWEIGSHSLNHRALTNLSWDNLDFDLSESKKILNDNGLEVSSISFPYGSYDGAVVDEVKKYYSSARVMARGYNNLNYIDSYHLKSYNIMINNSAEEVCSWIENTRPSNRWLILNFHYIDENENRPWDESVEDFKKILRCINEHKIRVMNINQVVKEYGKGN